MTFYSCQLSACRVYLNVCVCLVYISDLWFLDLSQLKSLLSFLFVHWSYFTFNFIKGFCCQKNRIICFVSRHSVTGSGLLSPPGEGKAKNSSIRKWKKSNSALYMIYLTTQLSRLVPPVLYWTSGNSSFSSLPN